MALFKDNEIDVKLALEIIKNVLSFKQFTVSKGRFPLIFPTFTETLKAEIVKQCNIYNNLDTLQDTMFFVDGPTLDVATINYRFEDVSGAFAEMKNRGITMLDLQGDTYGNFGYINALSVFQAEISSFMTTLFSQYMGKELKAGFLVLVNIEPATDTPMNMVIYLKVSFFSQ